MKATTGRIWEATSSFENRPALSGVHFDAENATLTASDSYIAARVPCEVEDGDESGVIPREALKTANGKSLRVAGGKAVLTLPDGERVWNLLLVGDEAPDFDKIFRAAEVIEAPIGLNPDLLKKLGLAMNGSTDAPLALHPRAPRTAIRVGTQPDVIGLIMPVVIGPFSRNGPALAPPPDLSNDEVVIAACRAALAQLDRRRGKRKAADAFRAALSSGASRKDVGR